MIGTFFAGTPPWPLVARTGCKFSFIEPDPLPPDPMLRKPVYDRYALTLEFIKEWPGATAADVWRGLSLSRRDDASRFLASLLKDGYVRWETDYHELTNLPIRRYYYIEE
jgi:hypothetical protein